MNVAIVLFCTIHVIFPYSLKVIKLSLFRSHFWRGAIFRLTGGSLRPLDLRLGFVVSGSCCNARLFSSPVLTDNPKSSRHCGLDVL